MAVATGSARVQYELKVKEKDNLFSCILHAVCSDDPGVEHGKPSPDIYLVAASKFTSPPKSLSNVLVFEDAPNGVEAAKKAGMVREWRRGEGWLEEWRRGEGEEWRRGEGWLEE